MWARTEHRVTDGERVASTDRQPQRCRSDTTGARTDERRAAASHGRKTTPPHGSSRRTTCSAASHGSRAVGWASTASTVGTRITTGRWRPGRQLRTRGRGGPLGTGVRESRPRPDGGHRGPTGADETGSRAGRHAGVTPVPVPTDECVEPQWRTALEDAGHDVLRVKAVDELGEGTDDEAVLAYAARHGRPLLTADNADFTDPPPTDHAGVIVVSDRQDPSGEAVVTAVQRVVSVSPAGGFVAYVSDRARELRQPGIEPGLVAWEATVLPLDHWRSPWNSGSRHLTVALPRAPPSPVSG